MRTLAPLVLALSLLAPMPAMAKDDYVFGPPPDWSEYKRLGEAAIRVLLAEPSGWVVEWPNGYKQGLWPMKGRPQDYVTCGTVHALKPIDGGYPTHWFAVIIDRGVVKGVDYKPKPANSIANLLCQGLVQKGALPPATMMAAASPFGAIAAQPNSGAAATITPIGIDIRAMPDGAYITRIAPGSPAAAAGLKPGMVIASVNLVPLAGMGEAMLKVIDAAGSKAKLTVVGGDLIDLAKPR